MAPSMLEPEVVNSHFHDMELCQLLHALDQPMGEPVKKAVRKAVRARVKKLGLKYDNEVRSHEHVLWRTLSTRSSVLVYQGVPEVVP